MSNGTPQTHTTDKPKAVKTAPGEAKPKKEKKAKDPAAVTRPRLPKPPEDHVFTILKPGSKARGAHDRFMEYKDNQTVRQYVDLIKEKFGRTEGQTFADIRWDLDHGFIHVEARFRPDLKPQPAPTPAPQA